MMRAGKDIDIVMANGTPSTKEVEKTTLAATTTVKSISAGIVKIDTNKDSVFPLSLGVYRGFLREICK